MFWNKYHSLHVFVVFYLLWIFIINFHTSTIIFFLQTLLRIWDCFLLDGLRVIFQFSVALLRYYEPCLLDKKDILAFLKDAKMLVKQTYDIEGLVQVSSDISIIAWIIIRWFPPYLGFATCSDYPSTQVQANQN